MRWLMGPLLLGLILGGCDNRLGGWDGSEPDADGAVDGENDGGDGGADADAGPDGADAADGEDGADGYPADGRPDFPWTIGSEETFEVVTWNIQNFPKSVQTASRVADFIYGMDVDLVAVQEITDQDAFEYMVDLLPNHDFVLSPDTYSSGDYQKTGFVFRAEFIQLRSVVSIFQTDWYAFPRPPLQASFFVHRPDGSIFEFIAIVVHLKASPGEDNEARRRDACQKLKTHVDKLIGAGGETEVVVLGDFNDSLDDPPADNVFTVFLDEPQNYWFVTDSLADGPDYSYIPSRVLIDHILVSAALFPAFGAGTVQAMRLEQLVDDFDYIDVVSDHRPMAAVFPW